MNVDRQAVATILVLGMVATSCVQAQERADTEGASRSPEEISIAVGGERMPYALDGRQQTIVDERIEAVLRYIAIQEAMRPYREALAESMKSDRESLGEKTEQKPEDIIEDRREDEERNRAGNKPLKPVVLAMRTIDYDITESTAINLRARHGYVSSINFFDSAGSPWPVDGITVGDSGAFSASRLDPLKGTVALEILRPFSESNALFQLSELDTPIVVRLIGENEEVDSRMNVRIPKIGPVTREKQLLRVTSDDEERAADDLLIQVLDRPYGIEDAEHFRLVAESDEALNLAEESGLVLVDGRLFLRTSHSLVSPRAMNTVSLPSGISVYEVPKVSQFMFVLGGRAHILGVERETTNNIDREPSVYGVSEG